MYKRNGVGQKENGDEVAVKIDLHHHPRHNQENEKSKRNVVRISFEEAIEQRKGEEKAGELEKEKVVPNTLDEHSKGSKT